MTRSAWRVCMLLAAAAALAAGCGSQQGLGGATASPPPLPSLALSVGSSTTAWATLEMGGSARQYNNFWQLFARPVSSARWRLVTPPGMASNGGFILASPGRPVYHGGLPSQPEHHLLPADQHRR